MPFSLSLPKLVPSLLAFNERKYLSWDCNFSKLYNDEINMVDTTNMVSRQ